MSVPRINNPESAMRILYITNLDSHFSQGSGLEKSSSNSGFKTFFDMVKK